MRQREKNHLVDDFYVDPNFAPAGQFLRSVKFLRRSELSPKEIIPRCQRDIFAPTEFEIKIWVCSFGREVEYTKIRRNEFPLCLANFFFLADELEIRRKCYDLKK